MAVRQPRYSKEEFAQRGNALYDSEIRSQVEEGNHGKIVAIDIETGAFEVADNTIEATDRLYERVPDAQPWVIRIGHRTVYRFGSRSLKKSV
jgi:peptide subunit release factor RF-3